MGPPGRRKAQHDSCLPKRSLRLHCAARRPREDPELGAARARDRCVVRSSGLPAPSRDRVAACGLGPGGQEGQAASGQQGIWTEPAGEPRLPRAPGRVEEENCRPVGLSSS